jgi:thiaminase/transcriptional activator TenA
MFSDYTQSYDWLAGVAAVLPCYWIYQHVGQHLKKQGSSHPKFQAWIDMYGGEAFDSTVQQALDIMDAVARELTTDQRKACITHFRTSARLEYMFWDGPYRTESWPC